MELAERHSKALHPLHPVAIGPGEDRTGPTTDPGLPDGPEADQPGLENEPSGVRNTPGIPAAEAATRIALRSERRVVANQDTHLTMITPHPHNPLKNLLKALLACALLCTAALIPTTATADEWWVEGDTVHAIMNVGYAPDLSEYSGTVAVRMNPVTVSGQFKIVTTVVNVTPQPGFTYVIRKAGGINGAVEIEFQRASCRSRFSFLYKPGLTRVDYGVLRCR